MVAKGSGPTRQANSDLLIKGTPPGGRVTHGTPASKDGRAGSTMLQGGKASCLQTQSLGKNDCYTAYSASDASSHSNRRCCSSAGSPGTSDVLPHPHVTPHCLVPSHWGCTSLAAVPPVVCSCPTPHLQPPWHSSSPALFPPHHTPPQCPSYVGVARSPTARPRSTTCPHSIPLLQPAAAPPTSSSTSRLVYSAKPPSGPESVATAVEGVEVRGVADECGTGWSDGMVVEIAEIQAREVSLKAENEELRKKGELKIYSEFIND